MWDKLVHIDPFLLPSFPPLSPSLVFGASSCRRKKRKWKWILHEGYGYWTLFKSKNSSKSMLTFSTQGGFFMFSRTLQYIMWVSLRIASEWQHCTRKGRALPIPAPFAWEKDVFFHRILFGGDSEKTAENERGKMAKEAFPHFVQKGAFDFGGYYPYTWRLPSLLANKRPWEKGAGRESVY